MLKSKNLAAWLILATAVCATGCTNMLNESKYSAFDYDPNKYWQAQATQDVKKPEHIAKNLKVQPLYPVPVDKKLNGELQVKKTPPTLKGKIADYS